MKEYSKTKIILKIYNRLHLRAVTVRSVKEWLDGEGILCSERSIYRYLDELTDQVSISGEEIEVSTGDNNQKIWKLVHSTSTQQLTPFDVNSLYLFYNFIPAAIQHPRKTSMEKIERVLHEQFSKDKLEANINSTQAHFYNTNFHESQYTTEEHEVLETLIVAIEHGKQVLVQQTRFDNTGLPEATDFSVPLDPVKVLFHRGTLHICFYSEKQKDLIILAIEQLVNVTVLDSTFNKRNIEEKLQNILNKRFGVTHNIDAKTYDIEIEFSEQLGDFVSRHYWHPTQEFTQLPTGNYMMKMHCGLNRELVGWIMMWMSNARVIKPKKLKKLVAEKLQHSLSYYQEDKHLSYNNTFRNTV
ncbi:MAG: WYL domain-containing protein [Bacteroidetes bacterium]|nr:WYL domain-containing protein [Bacteroidota bacterium]